MKIVTSFLPETSFIPEKGDPVQVTEEYAHKNEVKREYTGEYLTTKQHCPSCEERIVIKEGDEEREYGIVDVFEWDKLNKIWLLTVEIWGLK